MTIIIVGESESVRHSSCHDAKLQLQSTRTLHNISLTVARVNFCIGSNIVKPRNMFSKKKEVKKRPRDPGSLEQFGIFHVPGKIEDLGRGYSMDDENDEDLEAELAKLTSGDDSARQPRRKAPPIPSAKLDAMISESMKDIDPDAELSGDDDDPDILSELREITGDEASSSEPTEEEQPEASSPPDSINNDRMIELLRDRLRMYRLAETRAKNENENARSRRFGRGAKTLEGLLSSAQSGKIINDSDIPPILSPSATGESKKESEPKDDSPLVENAETSTVEIPSTAVDVASTSGALPEPEASVPEPTKSANIDQESLELLKKRQHEYKVAALIWKKAGNMNEALTNVKLAKQFDIVLAAVEAGDPIDLADMPPSPQLPSSDNASSTMDNEKQESEIQQQAPPPVVSSETAEKSETPITRDAVASALKERLEIYRRTKVTAEEEGNSSKARRYGRICKQFEDAIKSHARGKLFAYETLPVPPGFPPIMLNPPASVAPATTSNETSNEPIPEPEPHEQETPTSSQRKTPVPPPRINQAGKKIGGAATRAEKQASMLEHRQAELKQAALTAKKDGDLELARDYLRQAKGITPLIEASRCGLPVDLSSIPLSPNSKTEINESNLVDAKSDDSFSLVSSIDCLEEATGTDQQIYENMEKQLIKQAKWCLTTRDHSKALGDVPGYNRWERLALGYSHDLDMLRVRKRDGLPPPQHHYEVKTYAIVQSCTDLGDGDAEISIIRGVNYPKDCDTYVMFEYPYPTDSPQCDRTSTIRDTPNPEYEAVYTLSNAVDRTARQCQRVFKRHALKCQVWSKGGFFRSDSLVGTVTVKLAPLETQCILHDSFPLKDGRKTLGGKLEVKIRLRNPILTKQIEKITDKWLTIDH